MFIKRLPWSGVILQTKTTSIVIDPIYNVNTGFFGEPRTAFYPLTELESVKAVLITHTHSDHFDPQAILEFIRKDVPVYIPEHSIVEPDISKQLNLIELGLGDSVTVGDFELTASYSVDGLGDNQVSWIIKDGTHTVLHSGDTLWHGYWWRMSKQYGPFDVAFLPINGAIIEDPDLEPSGEPICLLPEQAVSAAKVLSAHNLVPIHYASFHSPPHYRETEAALVRLHAAANAKQVSVQILKPGESLTLS